MGDIVVTEFMTLDGVIEDPGGGEKSFEHSGWEFTFDRGDAGNQFKTEELMTPTRSSSDAGPTRGSPRRGHRCAKRPASTARR
jgi:hypothetical protein